MANDCWNNVVITGDQDILIKLKERFDAQEKGYLFTSTYATMFEGSPNGIEEDLTDYDFGSKRLDCGNLELEDDKLTFAGDSAWSPPMEFYGLLSQAWGVTVDVKYDERGMDFAGHTQYVNGQIEIDEEWTYWEYLYLNDREQFSEEIVEHAGWCETYQEVIDNLSPDKWKTKTDFDPEKYREMFESYRNENPW